SRIIASRFSASSASVRLPSCSRRAAAPIDPSREGWSGGTETGTPAPSRNGRMERSMDPLFDQIREAHVAIRPQVTVTPLAPSPVLSKLLGCDVSLKLDFQQPTGSFKIRGATNKVRTLDDDARRRGVLTASTGNHGMAVARAGALAGAPVTVYVGNDALQMKIDGIKALGAEVVVIDGP